MIERNAIRDLINWRDSPYRKPLLIRGARQVGKTTLVKQFSTYYEHFIYLNLELSSDLELFEQELGIAELYQLICLRKEKPMFQKQSLLFIDEIQNSAYAIKMLRYFYEELPELSVIAAGSLLEAVVSQQHISFPVGRIENLWLYPLCFDEYIGALNNQDLIAGMQEVPVSKPILIELKRLFKTYALLGGMPEIMMRHRENPDIVNLNPVYQALIQSYIEDVEKYAHGSPVSKAMRHILMTGFTEAGKRITLEGFANSNFKSATMKEAFSNLEKALLLRLQYPVTSTEIPIIPNYRRSPRLQMLDTGLLNFQLGIQEEFFTRTDLHSVFHGLIIQHLVGQELIALENNPFSRLTFWVREKHQSSAEVDFVLPYKGKLIPVEVKSGKTGTLRSLIQFMNTCDHDLAVRIYEGELRLEEISLAGLKKFRLLNLPTCLTGKISKYLDYYF